MRVLVKRHQTPYDPCASPAVHVAAIDTVAKAFEPHPCRVDGMGQWEPRVGLTFALPNASRRRRLTVRCFRCHEEPFSIERMPELIKVVLKGRVFQRPIVLWKTLVGFHCRLNQDRRANQNSRFIEPVRFNRPFQAIQYLTLNLQGCLQLFPRSMRFLHASLMTRHWRSQLVHPTLVHP